MKYLILIALCVLCAGCTPNVSENAPHTPSLSSYEIVKIRDCEYIQYSSSNDLYSYGYTHCGDCSNPIHSQTNPH